MDKAKFWGGSSVECEEERLRVRAHRGTPNIGNVLFLKRIACVRAHFISIIILLNVHLCKKIHQFIPNRTEL